MTPNSDKISARTSSRPPAVTPGAVAVLDDRVDGGVSRLESGVADKIRRATASTLTGRAVDTEKTSDKKAAVASSGKQQEQAVLRSTKTQDDDELAKKRNDKPVVVTRVSRGIINKDDMEKAKDKKLDNLPEQARVDGGAPSTAATTPERGTNDDYKDPEWAGLAVAVAVEDSDLGDDNACIPAAIEYDPDSKPPMYKNRRFRAYSLLAAIVIAMAAVVGIILGVTTAKKGNNADAAANVPTMSPTTQREGEGIQTRVERLVGSDLLEDPESPYSKALDWILFGDPMQLSPEDTNFVQRYICAYFYFATSVDAPWGSCNPPDTAWTINENWNSSSSTSSNDGEGSGALSADSTNCTFLQAISVAPISMQSTPANRWLSNSPECTWAGISCDYTDLVRGIHLSGSNLTGSFPEGVRHLSSLQQIDLSWSYLGGRLPESLAELKHLVSIELHWNFFTGTVPSSWWVTSNLQRINVGGNLLIGGIPPEIGKSQIKGLFMDNNAFDGTLSEEIGTCASLTYFRIQGNSMVGTIPETIASLENLLNLWIHRNQFTGTIPSAMSALSATLNDLRANTNYFTGTIPEELYSLSNLMRLELYENELSGTISSSIGNFALMQTLRLENNTFTGTLPVEMSGLLSASLVSLQANDFTGTMPTEVCASIQGLDGIIVDLEADCGGAGDTVELECDCCTWCCNADGNDCMSRNLSATGTTMN